MVIGLLRWTGVARLVRSEFLRLRNLDFVNAAMHLDSRLIGLSSSTSSPMHWDLFWSMQPSVWHLRF